MKLEVITACVPYRVPFADTDASGRLYWGALFRIFSEAEAALWRHLDVIDDYAMLPRAHVEANYLKAMAFDDELDVHATVEAVGSTSVTVSFRIERAGIDIANGSVVAVHVDEAGVPIPVPSALRSRTQQQNRP